MATKAERQQRLMADRERRHRERAPGMMDIDTADRYSIDVVAALADDFPDLRDNTVAYIVRNHVYLYARSPYRDQSGQRGLEVILDDPFTAKWRLVSSDGRVQVACWRPNPGKADRERTERLNAALDALVPGTDDKED